MSSPIIVPILTACVAFAVGGVVANHFHWWVAPGGYVGVDIFFVISGFLISKIMMADIAAGTFSFRAFYQRRMLRLIPALMSVLVATSVLASIMLFPSELTSYAKTVVASIFFGSNLFFLTTIDYFHNEGRNWPLLHTWSLGVEEQFYIIWPALLLMLTRSGRRRPLAFGVLGIGAGSFALATLALPGHPSFVFYMLPTRAWEFMLGVAIAAGLVPSVRNRPMREGIGWAGLMLIAAAVKYYGNTTPFPGPAALLPAVGAAAIIWAGAPDTTSLSRLLSLPAMRFLGRISYSLYLVHWPILFLGPWPMEPHIAGGLN